MRGAENTSPLLFSDTDLEMRIPRSRFFRQQPRSNNHENELRLLQFDPVVGVKEDEMTALGARPNLLSGRSRMHALLIN